MELTKKLAWVCGGVWLISLASGCGSGGGSGVTSGVPADEHIMQINALYMAYRGANPKPPATPEELKEWAKKLPPEKLAKMIKEPLDDVFISPRDKEPYQFAPPPKGVQMGPPRVVVYEKTGKGGKRKTSSGIGTVSELDNKQFSELVPDAK